MQQRCLIDSHAAWSTATLLGRQPRCSVDSHAARSTATLLTGMAKLLAPHVTSRLCGWPTMGAPCCAGRSGCSSHA